MIKKLKMRFVLVNMLILTFVLLATLSSIYIMMVNSEIKVSNEIMDTLIENHRKSFPGDKNHEPPEFDKEIMYSDYDNTVSIKELAYFLSDQEQKQRPEYKHGDDIVLDDPPQFWGWDPAWGDPPQFDGQWNFPWGNPWENPWVPPFMPPFMPPWEQPAESKPDDNHHKEEKPHESKTDSPPVTQAPESSASQEPETSVTAEQSDVKETEKEETTAPAVTETPAPSEQPVIAPSAESETSVSSDEQITESSETTSELTSTSDTTSETQTMTSPAPPPETKPSQKPKREDRPLITTRYSGNLVRSHILAEIGKNNEILDVSYQYFFQYNDNIENETEYAEKVRHTINSILLSGNETGKCIIENVSYRYKLNQVQDSRDRCLILLDRSIEMSTLNRLMINFIFIGCAGLIVVFFVSLFLANWAIKPIEVAWNRQKQFIADASHELKTPLTVIATNADVVLSTPNDLIKNQQRWLHYIKDETARMSKLVSELLYIAKSDSNEIKMEMSDFDISNTVSGVCLVFEPLAFEAGRELVCDVTPRLKFFGDEDRIKQLITILIDNAIKYSIIDTTISVSLFRNNQGRIKFCISNKCEELTEENISKLFDRFYRVDSSRNSGTGGNGLGLNIAQTITEAHNGIINVNYNYGMISFTVTF